jgi:hypothetical protein
VERYRAGSVDEPSTRLSTWIGTLRVGSAGDGEQTPHGWHAFECVLAVMAEAHLSSNPTKDGQLAPGIRFRTRPGATTWRRSEGVSAPPEGLGASALVTAQGDVGQ